MYTLSLKIGVLPTIITNGSQGSWLVKWKESKRWIKLVGDAVLTQGRPPPDPIMRVKLKLTRVSCAGRPPDIDNLASSFKYVLDALVKNAILVDDSPNHIIECSFHWARAPNYKCQHIQIDLDEVES